MSATDSDVSGIPGEPTMEVAAAPEAVEATAEAEPVAEAAEPEVPAVPCHKVKVHKVGAQVMVILPADIVTAAKRGLRVSVCSDFSVRGAVRTIGVDYDPAAVLALHGRPVTIPDLPALSYVCAEIPGTVALIPPGLPGYLVHIHSEFVYGMKNGHPVAHDGRTRLEALPLDITPVFDEHCPDAVESDATVIIPSELAIMPAGTVCAISGKPLEESAAVRCPCCGSWVHRKFAAGYGSAFVLCVRCVNAVRRQPEVYSTLIQIRELRTPVSVCARCNEPATISCEVCGIPVCMNHAAPGDAPVCSACAAQSSAAAPQATAATPPTAAHITPRCPTCGARLVYNNRLVHCEIPGCHEVGCRECFPLTLDSEGDTATTCPAHRNYYTADLDPDTDVQCPGCGSNAQVGELNVCAAAGCRSTVCIDCPTDARGESICEYHEGTVRCHVCGVAVPDGAEIECVRCGEATCEYCRVTEVEEDPGADPDIYCITCADTLLQVRHDVAVRLVHCPECNEEVSSHDIAVCSAPGCQIRVCPSCSIPDPATGGSLCPLCAQAAGIRSAEQVDVESTIELEPADEDGDDHYDDEDEDDDDSCPCGSGLDAVNCVRCGASVCAGCGITECDTDGDSSGLYCADCADVMYSRRRDNTGYAVCPSCRASVPADTIFICARTESDCTTRVCSECGHPTGDGGMVCDIHEE